MKAAAPSKLISPVGFQDILVLVALHSLVAIQLIGFADDPGLGRRLSSGRWMLGHHAIPSTDPFLFSIAPREWISNQWLSDVAMWLLYSAGSWPLLYGIFVLIFAVTYLGILYKGVTRITGQFLLSSLALIFAFKIGQVHFIVRPVVFSLFFFSIVYVLVADFYKRVWESEEPAQALRRLFYYLPPLFLVWANMHPAFPLGLLLVFLLPAAIGLDAWTGLKKLQPAHEIAVTLRRLMLLFLCCLIATFVTPYGYKLYLQMHVQAGDFAARYFAEWAALNFHQFEGQLFEISFLLLLLGFLFQPGLRERIGWFGFLSVLVFAHLGLNAVRFAPYYGIVVVIPLVYALEGLGRSDLLSRFGRLEWYLEKLAALELREKNSLHGYAVLSALLVLLLVDCTVNRKLLLYEGPFGPSADVFPYAAVDVVKETSLNEQPIVIAAPMDWGGFITFYGDGAMKAIIDDTSTLLGDEFYFENIRSLKVGGDWMGYLEKMGAQRLLLPREDPLAITIKESGEALPLFEDKHSILFELPSSR